jgi:mitogen-activated protein kinase kinase kinase 7
MELMEGGSFRDFIDNRGGRTSSLSQKVKIIMQSFVGLHYLHRHNPQVIHRDLKADNILLDRQLNAKIADFGVSRFTHGAAAKELTSFAGTVAWMAPEILRAEDTYTAAVDVYAMGMVIFEALTGEYPFDGMHLGQLTIKVAMEGNRPQLWTPSSQGEGMMQQVMIRCWAQEAEKRPASKDLIENVTHVLEVIQREEAGGAGGQMAGAMSF